MGRYNGQSIRTFIRFVVAEVQADEEQLVRDVYITSCLQNAVNNIANAVGGTTITKDYFSIITEKKPVAETRTEKEIYSQIKIKLENMGQ